MTTLSTPLSETTPPVQRAINPNVILVITLCAASFAAILIRYALNEGMNPLLIVATRLSLAALIYTPMVWKWHRPALANMSRRTVIYSIASGVFLGLHFIAFSLSLQHTSILVNQVITNIGPIWVALLEMFLLKVRQPRVVWVGILISFIGGMIIAFGNTGDVKTGTDATFGTMLALVGSLLASIYMVIGRRVRSEVPFIPYVWIVFGAGAVTALIAAVITGVPVAGYTPKAYLWLILIALIPQLIGHSGYNYLVGYFSATFISLVNLTVIITSAVLAYILFREVPGFAHEIGSLVIVAGVSLAVIGQNRADLLKSLWHKLKHKG